MSLIIAQVVDPNAGLTTRADFFAMCTMGLHIPTRRYYLLDMLHGRWDTTEHPRIVTEEYREWANSPLGVYYRTGVQTIFYESDLFRHLLHERIVPLKEIPRRAGTGSGALNKYMTMLNLQGRWERGQIVLPGTLSDGAWRPDYQGHPWLEGFEREVMSISFADGREGHAHDDQVETVALCVEMLSQLLLAGYTSREPVYHSYSWAS